MHNRFSRLFRPSSYKTTHNEPITHNSYRIVIPNSGSSHYDFPIEKILLEKYSTKSSEQRHYSYRIPFLKSPIATVNEYKGGWYNKQKPLISGSLLARKNPNSGRSNSTQPYMIANIEGEIYYAPMQLSHQNKSYQQYCTNGKCHKKEQSYTTYSIGKNPVLRIIQSDGNRRVLYARRDALGPDKLSWKTYSPMQQNHLGRG